MKDVFPTLNRNQLMAGVGVCGALALAGCGEPANFAGRGNEFDIVATVDHAGKMSVTTVAESAQVLSAEGLAKGWFDDDNQHQIHNNYKQEEDSFLGACEKKHFVGQVLLKDGRVATLSQVLPGERVEIKGAIRDSSHNAGKSCQEEQRPVYDTVTILGN